MIINREEYLQKLIQLKDKDIIKIITGIRRCGKSTLLNNIYYNYLINNGVDKNHIIKISFDFFKFENLRDPKILYEYISSNIIDNHRYYIFLDEIQLVNKFEDVLNGIKGEFNCDIYVTGSNSKLLSSDINTIFRGRGIEIKVFPFSFKEYYEQKKVDIRECFNEYILYGGLPLLFQFNSTNEKVDYLKLICDTVVTKDIIDRYNIRNENLFNSIVDLLCSSIGSYISSTKIERTLKSNGYKSVDNETISSYLSHMCDAFLFYKVQRFDIKGKEYLKTLNKYYICDLGIRNSKINYRQLEMTHIIENIVYLELLKQGYIVDIGKNSQKEIDFIAKTLDGELYYIQVSMTIEDSIVKEREISSFYNLDDGYKKIVITMDQNPLVNLEKGYKMMNLFDFLLDRVSLKEL